ncbi:viral IAP-associated factor homolog [Copidosoma floridanum]|uniref:viral IAP-associated factor homolog n=1 Tax=Copidosoma floridanum TaxID=29053 RepID=UPI0006C97C70|nr:viral IAP-associated factor homolog [Copidosoma floridanum]
MQNPEEDTEWNDILRAKGIIPEKKKDAEVTEEQLVQMLENTICEKTGKVQVNLEDKTLDELDELEDEEDERILLEYRNKRIAEIQEYAKKAKYGDVREISAQDYVLEVNQAGEDVWVVLHLYKSGIPLCTLVNQHLSSLAKKFPMTKFLKSISNTCIPNYPDANLPTIFIYKDGSMEKQLVGPIELRGMKLTEPELEWMLGKVGAVPTKIKNDPKPKVRDVLFAKLGVDKDCNDDLSDDNDW